MTSKKTGWFGVIVQKATIPWLIGAGLKEAYALGYLSADYTQQPIFREYPEATYGVVLLAIAVILGAWEVIKSFRLEQSKSYVEQAMSWNMVHGQALLYMLLPEINGFIMYLISACQLADAGMAGVATAYKQTRNLDIDDRFKSSREGIQAWFDRHGFIAFLFLTPVVSLLIAFIGYDLYQAGLREGGGLYMDQLVLSGATMKVKDLLYVLVILSVFFSIFRAWVLRGIKSYLSQMIDHLSVTGAVVAIFYFPFLLHHMFLIFLGVQWLVANMNGPITEKALQRLITFA